MKVFLLHTVRPGLNDFEPMLLEAFPSTVVYNLLDDFWIREVLQKGEFTKECRAHLLDVCISMERAGADLIVCTCSSLTPYWQQITPFIHVPVVAIDATLAKQALLCGRRIMVVATADTAVDSAVSQLRAEAERQHMGCDISTLCCDEAGQIMRMGGDMALHDALLLAKADEMAGYDVIVLAQLSTAHLSKQLSRLCKTPVLTIPELCIQDLKRYLQIESPPA